MKMRTPKHEVAQLIHSFLDGTAGRWDWDDFTSIPQADPEIELIRKKLISIHDEFPADKAGEYCNDEGASELLRIANSLEMSVASNKQTNK